MAHKSKKKHIKHLHEHETASSPPRAKAHAGAKADIEEERIAGPRSTRAAKPAGGSKSAAPKKRGIVRRIAKAATKKIAARPKRLIQRATSRVKSRVKSMFSRE